MDAVVPVDGFCHERFQGSGLTVKVNHAFLYICPLLAKLLEYLSLCYLGIQAQQLVNVVSMRSNRSSGVAKSSSSSIANTLAPWMTVLLAWSTIR